MGLLGVTWIKSSDLQLDAEFNLEWDGYIQHIKEAGVRLQEGSDTLIWTGGHCSDLLNAKNVYQALASNIWNPLTLAGDRGFGGTNAH